LVTRSGPGGIRARPLRTTRSVSPILDTAFSATTRATRPIPSNRPRGYRVDGKSGKATIVTDTFDKPNGLAFSPSEKKLDIIDTDLTHGGRSNMRVFDVDIGTGKVTNDKVFAENFAPEFTDGVRTDIDGNVRCSMGWADLKEDGVRYYAPSGDLIGKIRLPRDLRQSGLRRPEAKSLVCLREHLGLRGLC
jgi:sugar lactone lactonase YvrE